MKNPTVKTLFGLLLLPLLARAQALPPPANPAVHWIDDTGFIFYWDAVAGASGYDVQYWDGDAWAGYGSTARPLAELSGFAPDSSTYVIVRAYNSEASSDWTAGVAVTLAGAPVTGHCRGGMEAYPVDWPNSHYYARLCRSRSGLPVISAGLAEGASLERSAYLIDALMRSVHPEVAKAMLDNGFRHAVMARYPLELTTQLPEYSHLDPDYWDERARGLGAMPEVPLGSGAEENVMCHADDRYLGEDITIHEFAHSLHLLGLDFSDPGFSGRLQNAYQYARAQRLWPDGHYALTDAREYWAEGVQSFFDTNYGEGPQNRVELKRTDTGLYNLMLEVFGTRNTYSRECPRPR